MGYADGFYYGQGRIICDTSTFSVGDTIRVRSVYNVSQTEDKQVVTVGTPLIFTVPPYDYYKICSVQTINDTPTEVGGEYVEIGFGDLHRSNVLDKNSLGGVQGILNAHQEGNILAIGDEVPITVGGSSWIMQVGNIDTTNHRVDFVSKVLYTNSANNYNYTVSALRTAMQGFYSNIDSNDKQYIKEVARQTTFANYSDYVWCLGAKEVIGSIGVASQSQFPIFITQANRVKTYQGTASTWWTDDYTGSGQDNYMVDGNGNVTGNTASNSRGALPCFTLIADS